MDKKVWNHNHTPTGPGAHCSGIRLKNKVDPYVIKAIERAKNKLKDRCYSLTCQDK